MTVCPCRCVRAPSFSAVFERLDTCYHARQGHIPRSDDCGGQGLCDSGFAQKQTEGIWDGRCRGREDPGFDGREPSCDHGHGRVAEGVEVPGIVGPVPTQRVVNQRTDTIHRIHENIYLVPLVLAVVCMSCTWHGAPRPVPRVRVRGRSVLLHRVATTEVCGFDSGRESKGKSRTKASKDDEACRENHDESSGR